MFWNRKIAPDDLKRVDLLEEKLASTARRLAAIEVDLEEFYAKVNKARQRVNKEAADRERASNAGAPMALADVSTPLSREAMKEAIRNRARRGA